MDTLLLLHQAELASVMNKEFIYYYVSFHFLVLHSPLPTSSHWNSSSVTLRYFVSRLPGFQSQVRLPSQQIPDILCYLVSNCGPTLLHRPHIPTLQSGLWNNSPPGFLIILLSQQHSLVPIPTYTLTCILYILPWLKFLAFQPITLLEEWKHL